MDEMIHKSTTEPFGALVRRLRERRGLTQAQLDRATGRKPSWTNHLEAGTTPTPDQETCTRLAHALGVDGAEFWRSASYARLAETDPEALRTVLADRDEQRAVSAELGDDERRLVLALRRIDIGAGRPEGRTAASLVRLANLVLTRGHPAATSGPDVQAAARALDALDESSHHAARAALDIVVRIGHILEAEKERLGLAPAGPPPPPRRRRGRPSEDSA
ncbi:MAG: helix-turn-helix transcriptional regulator [Myxococcota bacterium]